MMELPNREKTVKELTRRYDEVIHKADTGLHDDQDAQQFISLVAHYINYVRSTKLTKDAIDALFSQQEKLAGDKVLIEEAEKIIIQLQKDRDKVVRYAKKKGIDVGVYQFDTSGSAQQITLDKEPSFYLTFLDDYLKLPSDQQEVSQLPSNLSRLRSIVFAVSTIAGDTKMLEKLRTDYQIISSEFEKKLRMQGVYLDYLRIEDYRALELIWREVYQEGSSDERVMFHLMYGDLFEKYRKFQDGQQTEADEFVKKHVTHLQRLHNYLSDTLEDIPYTEKFAHWTVEHFGPTLFSLIVILIIWAVLNLLGIKKGFEDLVQLYK